MIDTNNFIIRPMTTDLLDQAAGLEAICFSTPWSRESLAWELENPLARIIAAVEADSGILAGYIGFQWVLDEGSITNLAIAPPFRRRGLGSALLREAIAFCRSRAVHTLTLEVRQSNAAAIALYQGFGFRRAGRRPRYYDKPAEDALLLTMAL